DERHHEDHDDQTDGGARAAQLEQLGAHEADHCSLLVPAICRKMSSRLGASVRSSCRATPWAWASSPTSAAEGPRTARASFRRLTAAPAERSAASSFSACGERARITGCAEA